MINKNDELDLLSYARLVTHDAGLLKAKEMLEIQMQNADHSDGALEEEFRIAAVDKAYQVRNSVLELSPPQRKRIGIFVIFGIDVTGRSKNRQLIRRATKKLADDGFHAKLLETEATGDYETNASEIIYQLREELPKVDHAIFVAASKGVADLLTAFIHDYEFLPAGDRDKIKLVVSLSGISRESFVARYLAFRRTAFAFLFRTTMKLFPESPNQGIRALTKSPWEGADRRSVKKQFPNLKWISFSMLPDGKDGYVHIGFLADFLRDSLHKHYDVASPSDGLVETAATILPPGTEIPQWVIRGEGPHALALGRFLDGTPLAPKHQGGKKDLNTESGAEILDAFMRVTSQDFLD